MYIQANIAFLHLQTSFRICIVPNLAEIKVVSINSLSLQLSGDEVHPMSMMSSVESCYESLFHL